MPFGPAVQQTWRTARTDVLLDRPLLVGILNVTPDSFWDGGRHATVDDAVRHAEALLEQGADLLDIGGESSRPGARAVAAEEEMTRVLPVLDALVRRWPDVPLSVDTVKAAVAHAALDAGAAIVNDVSGLRLDRALVFFACTTLRPSAARCSSPMPCAAPEATRREGSPRLSARPARAGPDPHRRGCHLLRAPSARSHACH